MKTAVVYWSGTGNTEAMAGSVAEGAKSAGAEAEVFTPHLPLPLYCLCCSSKLLLLCSLFSPSFFFDM